MRVLAALAAVAATPLLADPSADPSADSTANPSTDSPAAPLGTYARAHYYLEHYPEMFGVLPLDKTLFHPLLEPHIDRSQPILDTCASERERKRAERAASTYGDWLEYLTKHAYYTTLFDVDESGDEGKVLAPRPEPAGWPTTYVAWTGDVMQWGAYARRPIKAGEVIDEYTGIALNNSRNNDYAWQYNWEATTRDLNGNTLQLVVDSLHHGNAMRFVNHADKQYLNVRQVYVPSEKDGMWHILYVASKDIARHEQMFVSYGDNYWATRPDAERL